MLAMSSTNPAKDTGRSKNLKELAYISKVQAEDDEKREADEELKRNILEKLNVKAIEEHDIEPRFARHLIFECNKYAESEKDFRETSNNELKRLVTKADLTLKEVDPKCGSIEKSLQFRFKELLESSEFLDMACEKLQQECYDVHPRVGVVAPRGFNLSAGGVAISELIAQQVADGPLKAVNVAQITGVANVKKKMLALAH